MKSFLQFLTEELSSDVYDAIAPYESFPPTEHIDQEDQLYKDVKFDDFSHYMKTQISVVTQYIVSQGIGDDPVKLKAAMEEAFMKPEIQKAFRLHYARNYPDKVS